MFNILKYNVNDVFCVGDIHGHFDGIPYFIKKYGIKDSLMIFCGDIGLGFCKSTYYTQEFNKLTSICKKNNVHIVFLRGNHDNPSYFDGKKVNRKWIKAVPDYTVIQTYLPEDDAQTVPIKTFLLVGGGVSIDRKYRVQQQANLLLEYSVYHKMTVSEASRVIETNYYWENELPVYNPEILDEIKNDGINIEYICTHSAPKFCTPTDKGEIRRFLEQDETLESDVNIERDVMTSVYDKVKADGHPLKAWYNGHFHKKGYEEFDNVKFYHLDMERNSLDAITVK